MMLIFKFVDMLVLRKSWLNMPLRTNSGAGLGTCCRIWVGGEGTCYFPCSELRSIWLSVFSRLL